MFTASALFGSAILRELADKAFYRNHIELSDLLKENAGWVDPFAISKEGQYHTFVMQNIFTCKQANDRPFAFI